MKAAFLHQNILSLWLAIVLAICANSSHSQCLAKSEPRQNSIEYDQQEIEKVVDLSRYNAFFYGEQHSDFFEPQFKLQFIKHLHARYGVRHLFMEVGVAAAWFFNEYLRTGDSSLINIKIPYNWKYGGGFWKELYLYNNSQPENNRIVIHGVDFERNEIFKLIRHLKPSDKNIPDHLTGMFNEIERLSRNDSLHFTDKAFSGAVENLRSQFRKYNDDMVDLFGENYDLIKASLDNLTPAMQQVIPRNKAWAETMEKIITREGITKLVCFFGKGHTAKHHRSAPNVQLIKRGYFTGKVISIRASYSHFAYRGDTPDIVEYLSKGERELFEKFFDDHCRAVIVKGTDVSEKFAEKYADLLLLARDVAK